MVKINNQTDLFIDCGYRGYVDMTTRAGKLLFVKDNQILVGAVTRDCMIDYNADYGRNHPYVPFNDFGTIVTYETQIFQYSSNTSTVTFGGDWKAQQQNGLGCTFIDTFFPAANLTTSNALNLSTQDTGYGTYTNPVEKNEHGAFVIGPKAAFHERVTIPTKQYKYWDSFDPMEVFTASYINMETSGNFMMTYAGMSGLMPELTDLVRNSKIRPNLLTVSNPPVYRTKAGEYEAALGQIDDSQTDTRTLSYGRVSEGLYDNLQQRYNLGDLSMPTHEDSFSFYLKIMPSGIHSHTRYVTLFQNHGIKVNLENNLGDTDFQLALYTKNHVDSTYRNGLPDNANYDYGFEPSPSAKNVDRTLQNVSNNVIYEWLGEDSATRNTLVANNHYVNKKFALGSFRRAGIETLERTGGTNSVTNNGFSTTVTTFDNELRSWWNCSYRFPERIKLNRTTSLVVSYDGTGDEIRKGLLLNQVRHPYNSGIIINQCPTLSVMYGPIDKGISNSINGYSKKYNEPDYVQTQPHSLKTYASYDLNFVKTKPIQGISSIASESNANTVYAHGYKYKDYFASGYLGDSYYIGTIDEFGYSNNPISKLTARKLMDSVVNMSSIVGRDASAFYDASGDFSEDFNGDYGTRSSRRVRLTIDPNYGTWDNTSIGNPSDYSVSSCMYFHVTDYPAYEEDRDKDKFSTLYPFPSAEDIILTAAIKHSSPNGAAPTVNFVIEDRPYSMTNNRGIEPNYSGKWVSPSFQLPASGGITQIYTSGAFDGGCGFWDISNKSVRLNVQYPSSGTTYSAALDVYAINLDVDWFKTSVPLTGSTGELYYIPLYTIGSTYEPIASGVDLYVEAARLVKDLNLFTKNHPSISGIFDLYVRGASAGWNGYDKATDLYTTAHVKSGIIADLYMPDPLLRSNGTLYAFIGESRNYVPVSSVINMSMDGSFVSPSGRQANLYTYGTSAYGDIDPSYAMSLFTTGNGAASVPINNLPLFITTEMKSISQSADLYLYNQWSGSTNAVNSTVIGSGKYDNFGRYGDGIPLYIERKMIFAARTDLFMEAHENPITNSNDMYMYGDNGNSSGNINLFLSNRKEADNIKLFTRGF